MITQFPRQEHRAAIANTVLPRNKFINDRYRLVAVVVAVIDICKGSGLGEDLRAFGEVVYVVDAEEREADIGGSEVLWMGR